MRYDDYDDVEYTSRRRREGSAHRSERGEAETTRARRVSPGSSERPVQRRTRSVEADMLAGSTTRRTTHQSSNFEEDLYGDVPVRRTRRVRESEAEQSSAQMRSTRTSSTGTRAGAGVAAGSRMSSERSSAGSRMSGERSSVGSRMSSERSNAGSRIGSERMSSTGNRMNGERAGGHMSSAGRTSSERISGTRTSSTHASSTRTARTAGAAAGTRAASRQTTRTASTKSSKHSSAYAGGYTEKELQSAERKRQARSEKQKKAKKRRRRLAAIIVLEAILLTAALAFIWVISKYDTIQKPTWGKNNVDRNTAMADEVVEQMKEGYTDIMVFGVDATSTLDGGSGADVNILVHINNKTGEIQLVSLYRDLYLNVGGSEFRKLTDIYRRDGAEGALGAINMNLDLHIDQFLTVNWESIAKTIDLLGGVEINVPEVALWQLNGYITETVKTTGIGSTQLKKPGVQRLDGIQTVAFCRIRKINMPGYSAGDYGRTERQREVIALLLQQAKKCSLSQLNAIADGMLPEMLTNVELATILGMASNVMKYDIVDTKGFPFNQVSSDVASSIVNSRDIVTDIEALHHYLYGTDTGYEVSDYAKEIAKKLYAIPGVNR